MPKQKIILKGIGASPGKVQGEVKIVNFPREIERLKGDKIIVSSFLTPDFLAIVRKNQNILGIITDKGGRTCHAAIVAREQGIPYIAGAINATKLLKKNIMINMNGEKGTIYEIG